jgi:PKD repeat protein/Leucine-rich repeat (LRR) protein
MKRKLLFLLFLVSFSTYAQYTAIPDVNFEKFLINERIDSGVTDGQVLTSSISALKSLSISGLDINDLTGIQNFTSLTSLNCSFNNLTSLNVSKNVALTNLNCFTNKLTSLDVTNNLALTTLNCAANKITSLDVAKNLSLSSLNCYDNQLPTINVTNNIALTGLNCNFNPFTGTLDLTQNIALTFLNCNYNQLATLNVSKNTALTSLNCMGNVLKSLDVSKNKALTFLDCRSNQLTSLDLKNGNNANLSASSDFKSNPSLTCIQVDNATFSSTKWATTKDATASYNLDCSTYTLIPDLNFENYLIAIGLDKDGVNGKVLTENIATVKSFDISNSLINITDLTGIQDFSALESLTFRKNTGKLTFLDISKNLNLKILNCDSNQLTVLDVSKNLKLSSLFCSSNQLTSLNVSKNLILKILHCSSNQLTSLDFSKNVALETISCDSNNLSSLNLKNGNNTQLYYYYGGSGFIKNPNLTCITVDDEDYANANWANKKDYQASYSSLDCGLITLIPDSKFEDKLIALGIDKDGNNGSVQNTSIATLASLNVSKSTITNLSGIEGFLNLKDLNCSDNVFESINLSKNNALTTLNCATNPNLTCIQVANVAYATANWTTTKDAKANFNLDCTRYTTIPDSKFEDDMIASNIDRDGKNGKVATRSIANITSLDVSSGYITNLTGIQDFKALTTLICHDNQLTYLDVSKNVALTGLYCNSNQLTYLDVSKNVALRNLYCDSNKLLNLNLKNGKNTLLVNISFTYNPNLKCILVDNVAYSITNWSTKKDATATFNTDCTPYTLIPDANFENQLMAMGIDKDGKNGKVETASIASVPYLYISSSSIADLTGIQDFVALTDLQCSSSQLTSLDVSKNVLLSYLNCSGNKLTSLDVSRNLVLANLNSSLNQLTSLDVSKNVALRDLNCSSNKLLNLNLKNGKNTLLTNAHISLSSNPNLKCILVDDVTYSNTNWSTKKDATADYNTDCSTYTLIPNANFTAATTAVNSNGSIAFTDSSTNTPTSWAWEVTRTGSTTLTSSLQNPTFTFVDAGTYTVKLTATNGAGSNTKTVTNMITVTQTTSIPVANFTAATTVVSSNGSIAFTDISTNKPTSWAWEVSKSGSTTLISSFQNPTFTFVDAGFYTVKLTVTNSAGSNTKTVGYMITVTLSTLIPVANFTAATTAVNSNGSITFTDSSTNTPTSWAWEVTRTGSTTLTSSLQNPTFTFVDAGTYTVKLTATNGAGSNTKTVTNMITVIPPIVVPVANFTAATTAVNSNGSIAFKDSSTNIPTSWAWEVTRTGSTTLTSSLQNPTFTFVDAGTYTVKLTATNGAGNNTKTVANMITVTLPTSIPVANFTTATTAITINSNESIAFTDSSTNTPTSWAWEVTRTGSTTLTSSLQNPTFTFVDAGTYTVKLTATNGAGSNTKTVTNMITVTLPTLIPVANFTVPTTSVNSNGSIVFKDSSTNTPTSWAWEVTRTGSTTLTSSVQNPTFTFVDAGTYTVKLTATNGAGSNTKTVTNMITVFISLPSNNFTVESKGESCLGENNGEISITAKATYSYIALINGKSYPFVNNALKVSNLVPATYNVSISITGENFEQKFTINISKGATITGKSSVAANKVEVEIAVGTAPYKIFVNGREQFETTSATFSVDVNKGDLLEVKTAKACEGIYSKGINDLVGSVSAYPNPTSGGFEITLPITKKEIVIDLYTINSQLISRETYSVENGRVQLTLENQAEGIYIAKIYLDKPEYLKIIKK